MSGHLFNGVVKKLPVPDMEMINATFYSIADVRAHALDNWVVYNGKVYDLSIYLEYHPGGLACLQLGGDMTRACASAHPWVNIETMICKL